MKQSPLRIVHCATFCTDKFGMDYYSGNHKISNGLIRNGHNVYDFSYRDIARKEALLRIKSLGITKMNQRLIETVSAVQPDLLLLGHSELIANETLFEIRKIMPNMKIAMWWVDPLDGFLVNRDFFIERINWIDEFFLTTDPRELKNFFALDKPLENIHFMPNICDASMDNGRAFDVEDLRHDLLFIGRKADLRATLIEFLETELAGLNVGLYGQNRDTLVQGRAYIDLLSDCRMAINFSRYNDISLYSSDRQVHLAANGCLTFTPDTPNMRDLFSAQEMVYFSDFEDLKKKIMHYQAHPDEGRRIAEAGHARAHRDYECQVVTAQMMDKIFS